MVEGGREIKKVQFWKRLLAFIIDMFMINLVVIFPFQNLFIGEFSKQLSKGLFAVQTVSPKITFAIFIIAVLAVLYFVFFEYYIGRTIGQSIMRLRVDTKDSKEEITFFRVLLSNCFILPFFPFYIFWFIEPIYVAFYKERFLERIAGIQLKEEENHNYLKSYKLKKV